MGTKIINPKEQTEIAVENNQRMYAFMYGISEIAKTARKDDIYSLEEASQNYLMLCQQFGMRVTNATWYAALGISKQVAELWRNEKRRATEPRYKKLIDNIDMICAASREQMIVEGMLNPVSGIWLQKIHDGYREDTPVINATITDNRERTAAEIAEQYKYLIPEDTAEEPGTNAEETQSDTEPNTNA